MSRSRLSVTPYRLPLNKPWISAHAEMKVREGWLIRLEYDGLEGYGDSAPLPETGTESRSEAADWLNNYSAQFAGPDPATLLLMLDGTPTIPPSVRCGLETAIIDLLAQIQGVGIVRWLNPEAVREVCVNANLGLLSESTGARLDDSPGFSVYKIKVGLQSVETELELLRKLADNLPPDVRLRLDANQAWDIQTGTAFIDAIADLPIESLEEPLASPNLRQLSELQQRTSIPIAMDESIALFDDKAIVEQRPVKRLVLKPMVQGGMRNCLKLARQARDSDMDTVITTTVDSAIGVWAAMYTAAALGAQGEALCHGLATSEWLAEDVSEPPAIESGRIRL